MKKIICLLIFTILTASVSASHIFINSDNLREGDANAYKTEDGIYIINLVIVSDSENAAIFEINHKKTDTLREGDNYLYEDGSVLIVKDIIVAGGDDKVEYYFYGSGQDPIPVDLDIDDFDIEDCNFDGGCVNETKDKCCYDCGCEARHRCENNKCVKMEGCVDDEECDDEKACTKDSCSDEKCSYESLDGCEFEGKCLEYGTIEEIDEVLSYCSENKWNPQREQEEECANDYECLNNKCKDNKCYKASFKWLYSVLLIILILIGCYFVLKYKIVKKIKRHFFWRK